MPVIISDDILRESGLGEKDALVEIACRLFDAGKISLPLAARLAALSRGEMEDALFDRRIPLYRPTLADYEQDTDALRFTKKEN